MFVQRRRGLRSTKAGALAPATRASKPRSTVSWLHAERPGRSTKAGALAPATPMRDEKVRGRRFALDRSTKAGALAPATREARSDFSPVGLRPAAQRRPGR